MSGLSDPRRYSLIALIALQRAKAIRDREQREAEKTEMEAKPKKKGWFR
ncbi:hypothetical protein [Brevundimonas sp. AAP58]|nr:hypothetical protein [Brevundimonas sp. AAP58]